MKQTQSIPLILFCLVLLVDGMSVHAQGQPQQAISIPPPIVNQQQNEGQIKLPQPTPAPQGGVQIQGTTGSRAQTTVIDSNGNLKIVGGGGGASSSTSPSTTTSTTVTTTTPGAVPTPSVSPTTPAIPANPTGTVDAALQSMVPTTAPNPGVGGPRPQSPPPPPASTLQESPPLQQVPKYLNSPPAAGGTYIAPTTPIPTRSIPAPDLKKAP